MVEEQPEIQRIDSYDDPRFSREALCQHGAFLVDGEPCEVVIFDRDSARIKGGDRRFYRAAAEEFRFFAGHISKFYDDDNRLVCEYPAVKIFPVSLKDIQPSQFCVDEDKLRAVSDFVHKPEDVIIPVTALGERFLSQDGHTRLAAAVKQGFDEVFAFEAGEDEQFDRILQSFGEEARSRGVYSPYDLKTLPHAEYEIKWNQFCDEYFKQMEREP